MSDRTCKSCGLAGTECFEDCECIPCHVPSLPTEIRPGFRFGSYCSYCNRAVECNRPIPSPVAKAGGFPSLVYCSYCSRAVEYNRPIPSPVAKAGGFPSLVYVDANVTVKDMNDKIALLLQEREAGQVEGNLMREEIAALQRKIKNYEPTSIYNGIDIDGWKARADKAEAENTRLRRIIEDAQGWMDMILSWPRPVDQDAVISAAKRVRLKLCDALKARGGQR